MKRYIGHATTQFYGMEWGQKFLVSARNLASAEKKANKEDWTHGNGYEEQKEVWPHEIPEEHYQILKEYIMEI